MKTGYDLKLEQVDEYLMASGWIREGETWRPPRDIAYALRTHAPNWETATWRRCYAVMLQVQYDEAASASCNRFWQTME